MKKLILLFFLFSGKLMAQNAVLQLKSDSTAAAKGLRSGKYLMYKYKSDVGYYQGYFMIYTDGTYEFFLDNSQQLHLDNSIRNSGKGQYTFDKTTGNIKWLTGPFLILDGIGHLSVSIDGQAYVIQSLTKDGLGGTYVEAK